LIRKPLATDAILEPADNSELQRGSLMVGAARASPAFRSDRDRTIRKSRGVSLPARPTAVAHKRKISMLTSTAPDGLDQEAQHLSPCSGDECDIRTRAEAILRNEVDFIPNASFVQCDHEAEDLTLVSLTQLHNPAAGKYPNELPAHLARLCEARLLAADEERELFRTMNYVKYRVNVLRSQLDPTRPDLEIVEKAETFLWIASRIRDRIVQANMRLAISVVKKFVTPQYSFDELLSDAVVTLLQAVNKFDYDRGFRFSTYAYRSIARNAYRQIADRQKDFSRFSSAIDDVETPDPERSMRHMFNTPSGVKLPGLLDEMLSRLDRRERFIVRRRYAMGRSQKMATFQSMADKLGVSKERVRQLEIRAVGKLQAMAAERGMLESLD
jgi:RNA polymerase primary sigma factor